MLVEKRRRAHVSGRGKPTILRLKSALFQFKLIVLHCHRYSRLLPDRGYDKTDFTVSGRFQLGQGRTGFGK